MEKIKKSLTRRILKILMWVFIVLIVIYLISVGFRVVHLFDVDKTNVQVEKIHATKLTMDDVMGKNLPPDPGIEADKTIQGIDANKNGIRDDVELAVFKEYPNSAKTRAVLLQYALALQMETIQPIVNTVTATEVVREQSRAFQCVGSILPNKESDESYKKLLSLISYVEDNQFNTKERKDSKNIFLKEVRSFSDLIKTCDIDYSKLPN